MHRLIAVLCMVVVVGAPLQASAKACYTMAEAEAEQAIRIHSELMVIGLNCQHAYKAGEQNLYAAYRAFTADHAAIFAAYEVRLLDYFRRVGVADPEKALNTLRTAFANKVSTDAAQMRPDVFCHRYAPRIEQAASMSDDTLRRWAATFHESHPVTRPVCR